MLEINCECWESGNISFFLVDLDLNLKYFWKNIENIEKLCIIGKSLFLVKRNILLEFEMNKKLKMATLLKISEQTKKNISQKLRNLFEINEQYKNCVYIIV